LQYQKLQPVFECCLAELTHPNNRFVTRLLPCRCSKSAQKSRCSGVSSHYCCHGNHSPHSWF